MHILQKLCLNKNMQQSQVKQKNIRSTEIPSELAETLAVIRMEEAQHKCEILQKIEIFECNQLKEELANAPTQSLGYDLERSKRLEMLERMSLSYYMLSSSLKEAQETGDWTYFHSLYDQSVFAN